MIRTLKEVNEIVQKAAFGAGIPMKQAGVLTKTALYMAANRDALTPIVDALTEPSHPLDVAWGGERLVIKAGTAAMTGPVLRDGFAMGVLKARLASPAHAPLVIAMLAEGGFDVSANGAIITLIGSAPHVPIVGPVDIPDEIWHALATFAEKT